MTPDQRRDNQLGEIKERTHNPEAPFTFKDVVFLLCLISDAERDLHASQERVRELEAVLHMAWEDLRSDRDGYSEKVYDALYKLVLAGKVRGKGECTPADCSGKAPEVFEAMLFAKHPDGWFRQVQMDVNGRICCAKCEGAIEIQGAVLGGPTLRFPTKELQEQIEELEKKRMVLADENTHQEQVIADLRVALKKFGRHTERCPRDLTGKVPIDNLMPCDCGFHDALVRREKP